ncbi:MAG: RagB/SusD family nutrient uptake outer membrane protein [Parabacteroides sp.]|nr:RagB/SusD family nutrient uptake outer membrane protein [Parabacteroides sp.]
MKKIIVAIFSAAMISFSSCESYLDINPDDKITDEIFWTSTEDATLALNGIYSVLRNNYVYGYGGGYDACTPNAYQWAHWEGKQKQVGNGTITSGIGGIVSNRWKYCFQGVYRANYFLEHIESVPNMDAAAKEVMLGEVYFLRALFYDVLVRSYGGVPLILKTISPEEGRSLSRASAEDIWNQVRLDYDEAIKRLPKDASDDGRATLGSALGMKMKTYMYTSDWEKVLEYCDKIDQLGKYKLYPSYQGLFQYENEGNDETLFALSFMDGVFKQGSVFDRYWQPQNLKYGIDGSNSVAPTQLLVDEYETLDGSPVDKNNPYANRDPRLDFTVLRPGAYFQGQLYPTEIKNHTGQKVAFAIRKYTIETMQVVGNQSPLDFMILRYGDVLLCRAEAMIELNKDINGAIALVNRIRTERTDVKMPLLKQGMSQTEARKALRHERRIELALEGQFWDDIKRWNAGSDYYPCEVYGALGEKLETKFPDGYNVKKDNVLPIPDSEISLNNNLKQNEGY